MRPYLTSIASSRPHFLHRAMMNHLREYYCQSPSIGPVPLPITILKSVQIIYNLVYNLEYTWCI